MALAQTQSTGCVGGPNPLPGQSEKWGGIGAFFAVLMGRFGRPIVLT